MVVARSDEKTSSRYQVHVHQDHVHRAPASQKVTRDAIQFDNHLRDENVAVFFVNKFH